MEVLLPIADLERRDELAHSIGCLRDLLKQIKEWISLP